MAILYNVTDRAELSPDVWYVRSPIDRAIGWLRASRIAPLQGKWLKPCSAIHTFGMRTHIDVILLDHDSAVVDLFARVSPNRLWISHRRASSVIEMGPGFLDSAAIAVGDRLALIEAVALSAEDVVPC